MKIKKPLLLLLVFLFASFYINAQKDWKSLSKLEYNNTQKEIYFKKNFPSEYKLVSLNLTSFISNLNAKSKKGNEIIELPDAAGNFKKFLISETSNFEKGLQQKFPNIKSFTAKGIDDPTASAKLSLGTDGLHGVVFSGQHSTVYIDPYSKDLKDYIVYNKKNLQKVELDFQCKIEDNIKSNIPDLSLGKFINDGKLRTFRLALACSGEYAQFHIDRQGVLTSATVAEKKAAVLSAMNTSMTRINGIFEIDLGVRMVLVGNNENVIFLDATTDEISDGNASLMIEEVQAICDAQIGSSNYDIGHIFSIGGDGLAGLGVVCKTGSKAKGVTGISSPVNDPYDIDYVAHELGHQFGATHTQNNDCNRTDATAVEAGSGSTIMGYAGICAPDVIGVGSSTGNSDDYFHAVSIAQMQQYIQGSGNCAILSDTNNATPTASAGLDYHIPHSTPFKLTGVATDADGLSSLTYNWEQIDSETATMPPSSTNTVGPMFRSLPSKTTPIRYFPDLTTIIAGNTSTTWEVLPSVARELNFAFTVRDNNSGGGSTARDDMKLTVTNSSAFRVTSQSTATTWNVGATETITWERSLTHLSPINCSLVNIRLSTDGGLTFPIVLKSNTANDGTEDLVIPNHISTNAKIMVEAADNVFYNVNSGTIQINSTTPTFILANTSGNQNACNSGNASVSYTINVDFVNNFSETVSFTVSGEPTNSQVTFSPTTINSDGNVVMTVSNLDGATSQNYTLAIQGSGGLVVQNLEVNLDVNSSTFSTLSLTSPSNNATNISLTPNLTWELDVNASTYDVEIASDSQFNSVVSSGTVSGNTYVASNLNGNTQYFWRVKPKNTCAEGSFSSVFSFTTLAPSYCASTFTDDSGGAEHITNVTFNTIINNSGNSITNGYEDFTNMSTTIKRENAYQISVTFDTGGYQDQCFVYIDWNQDYLFDNNTEKYDLGKFTADIATATFNISVPSDARLGTTRMRVFIEYFDDVDFVPGAGACDPDHESEWGETEDYSLVIEEATASIEDTSFNKFNLFPNPNSGSFTLLFETIDTSKTTIELFDVRGRRIAEKTFTNTSTLFRENIHFNNLSKGLYLLKIHNGNKQTTRKLVVE